MPTNAVLRVPAEDVALAETVERLDDCRFRVEETAFTDDGVTVHLWIFCPECSAVESALAEDPSVESYSLVREADDEWLFKLEIADRLLLVRDVVHRFDGTIREAYGREGTWTMEVRFPSREQLSSAAELFDEYDVAVTFQSITDHDDPDDPPMDVLTDRQREVLEAAIDRGYYEVPREVTLEELADDLDISHQALSECLRRAQENLAADTLNGQTEAVDRADGTAN